MTVTIVKGIEVESGDLVVFHQGMNQGVWLVTNDGSQPPLPGWWDASTWPDGRTSTQLTFTEVEEADELWRSQAW